MESFNDYCKSYIKEHIHDYVGQSEYGADLCYTITQAPNMDGSLTYSRYDAMEYLKEWWWDAADYYGYAQDNFGEVKNPFDNPEAYMVCMVIQGVSSLLSQCSVIEKNWNDEFELTDEIADEICTAIDDLKVQW